MAGYMKMKFGGLQDTRQDQFREHQVRLNATENGPWPTYSEWLDISNSYLKCRWGYARLI
jgi:hypothetical protein